MISGLEAETATLLLGCVIKGQARSRQADAVNLSKEKPPWRIRYVIEREFDARRAAVDRQDARCFGFHLRMLVPSSASESYGTPFGD
jgi:hypothetical protein